MTVVAFVCAGMLIAAAILALIRAERGPSMLDRTVALDVFVTAVVGGIVLESAYSGRTDTLPILVVLSLVGFVGSVTIARFAAVEPKGEGRVRTAEEIALEEAQRFGEELEPEVLEHHDLAEPRDLIEPRDPKGSQHVKDTGTIPAPTADLPSGADPAGSSRSQDDQDDQGASTGVRPSATTDREADS